MSFKRIPLGDISVNFIDAMIQALRALKVSPTPLLERYQLSDSFLNTPDARISIPKFMRLGHEAIRLSHVPHFGLLMGQHITVANMGISGFAAMTASTVGDCLKVLIQLESLNSHNSRGHSSFHVEEDRAVCQFYSISPYNQFNYFVVDSMLSSWFHFANCLTDQPASLHLVEVEYSYSAYQHEYERLFNCPVYFGAKRNALVFKSGARMLPSKYSNTASHQAAMSICLQEKKKLDSGKTTKDRVIDLISAHLSGSPPNIQDIAQQMGMAGWTLRRRLKEEDEQFQTILDDTRQALAKSYVCDTDHNFTEIAFLLGFSSPAAFQRAFKRWTGTSPGDFRKESVKAT